jgi:threonine/homoserine/homoserine lactone efflux protein
MYLQAALVTAGNPKATVGKYVKRVIGGTFIGTGIGFATSNK